jgi:hypothetical protein
MQLMMYLYTPVKPTLLLTHAIRSQSSPSFLALKDIGQVKKFIASGPHMRFVVPWQYKNSVSAVCENSEANSSVDIVRVFDESVTLYLRSSWSC